MLQEQPQIVRRSSANDDSGGRNGGEIGTGKPDSREQYLSNRDFPTSRSQNGNFQVKPVVEVQEARPGLTPDLLPP